MKRKPALGATLLAGALITAIAGTAPAFAAGHHARGLDYVALGDSYASAPVVPTQVDAACARSDHNYPSLVAAAKKATLTDVSCSGATTADMTAPQGSVPPQFAALDRHTDLVTVTIGGNDIGFSTILGTCAQLTATDPAGAPCQAHFTSGGTDQLKQVIDRTAPKVAKVLRGIQARAPHARVLLVGYPDLFPNDGVGCTSQTTPFAAGDFAYMRDTEKRLNGMLARTAAWNHAGYVDTNTPTIGHDMCQLPADRWIENLAPASPAAPAHPNALGEQAMAKATARHLAAHR
ncbi:SGNH/GDSL hydrolase family protein [Streptomyces sp. NBC_01190]|uniref:SGNH/GDSL hydrolase family protein n=1 Tax=Streptomyces sp. NBC_01190 TaxID=2903767 RepID=UPI003864B0A7|nr:SGNH/GDSL hydrolase family protein [Streptomyces sp. NBC_01190]